MCRSVIALLLVSFTVLITNISTIKAVAIGYEEPKVPIEGRLQLPDKSIIPFNYELTLNGNEYSTISRMDGSFTFHDIPSGIYLLSVGSVIELFPQMKLKVSAENGTMSVVEYKYPGAKRIPAPYPLVITAVLKPMYFKKKPQISLMGLIAGNPMIIMMIIFFVVMVAFPKILTAGLSPEEMQELKKQQSSQGDPMQELSKLMGVSSPKPVEEDEDE